MFVVRLAKEWDTHTRLAHKGRDNMNSSVSVAVGIAILSFKRQFESKWQCNWCLTLNVFSKQTQTHSYVCMLRPIENRFVSRELRILKESYVATDRKSRKAKERFKERTTRIDYMTLTDAHTSIYTYSHHVGCCCCFFLSHFHPTKWRYKPSERFYCIFFIK